jgi:hypothetical protein
MLVIQPIRDGARAVARAPFAGSLLLAFAVGCAARQPDGASPPGPATGCAPRSVGRQEPTDLGITPASTLSGPLRPRALGRVSASEAGADSAAPPPCLADAAGLALEFALRDGATSAKCTPERDAPSVHVPVRIRVNVPGCAEISGDGVAALSAPDEAEVLANGTLSDSQTGDRWSLTARLGSAASVDLMLWNVGQPEPAFKAHYVQR